MVQQWIEKCLDNLQPLPERRRSAHLLFIRLIVLLNYIYDDPDGREHFTNSVRLLRSVKMVPSETPEEPEKLIKFIHGIEDEEEKLRTIAYISTVIETVSQLLREIKQRQGEE